MNIYDNNEKFKLNKYYKNISRVSVGNKNPTPNSEKYVKQYSRNI